MSSRRRARHSSAPERRWVVWLVAGLVIAAAAGATMAVKLTGTGTHEDRARSSGQSSASAVRADPAAETSTVPRTTPVTTPAPSPTPTPTPTRPPGPPPVLTPGGMWWGVDSSGPITAAAIQNVADWYLGSPRPQFWGRYIGGDYSVTAAELAFARSQQIYVFLLVNDRNCSECAGGGDVCGNDSTAAQARADALAALDAAKSVGVPDGTVLFKDIEQVSSCRSEPTATYLITWYQTVAATRFRTGFYGNSYQPNYDFPRGYCAAVAASPAFAKNVVLDMNEDEPQLGAPRQTVGPRNAPAFAPLVPACAPRTATKIWQYGESTDKANYTDIDQARPDTPGMLAPDGSVTP